MYPINTTAQAANPVAAGDDTVTNVITEPQGFATCPRCHMVDTALTNASLETGGNWRCARCGQSWDKGRIATVAAYTAWDSARSTVKPSAEAGPAPAR